MEKNNKIELYPKEWNIIPIEKNSKKPMVKWEKYQSEKYPKNILNKHDGNYALICGKISNNIVVLDFDFKEGGKKHFKEIIDKFNAETSNLLDTFIVETPHGFHAYYYLTEFTLDRTPNKNLISISSKKENREIFRGLVKTNFAEFLNGFDILGNNGYVVLFGSKANNFEYKIYKNSPDKIKKITKEQWERIRSYFLLEKAKQMRKPFIDILNGKIDLKELSIRTGKDEFVYWISLYKEAYNYIGLKPQDLYPFLEKNQPEFNREKTEEQLKYHPYNEKPLTNDSMKEYFPDHPIKKVSISKENRKKLKKDEEEDEILKIAREIVESLEIATIKDKNGRATDLIFVRNGISYHPDAERITRLIKKRVEELDIGQYKAFKGNVLEVVKDSTLVDSMSFFCDDPGLIPFENGVYDGQTNTFHNLDEINLNDYRFFYHIPIKVDNIKHKCPLYKKSLRLWLTNKEKPFPKIRVKDIFEIIGLSLSMNSSFKKCFILLGPSDTGKTQFHNILNFIIPEKVRSATPIHRITKNEFGLCDFPFKIANIVDDMPSNKIIHTGIYKALYGGGVTLQAEDKGGKPYSFKPYLKGFYNTNKLGEVADPEDEAFFNRHIIIEFLRVFEKNNPNTIPKFSDKITGSEEEIQGIIYESLKGFHRLLKRGHFRIKLEENTNHIWNYNSDPMYKFIFDNCMRKKSERIEWEEFKNYYASEMLSAESPQSINTRLTKLGFIKKRGSEWNSKKYFVYGVAWRSEFLEKMKIEDRENDSNKNDISNFVK